LLGPDGSRLSEYRQLDQLTFEGHVVADVAHVQIVVMRCRKGFGGLGEIAQAHKPDEWITLDQVARCERFMARLIERLSGAPPHASCGGSTIM
jgi:hypothetical protein